MASLFFSRLGGSTSSNVNKTPTPPTQPAAMSGTTTVTLSDTEDYRPSSMTASFGAGYYGGPGITHSGTPMTISVGGSGLLSSGYRYFDKEPPISIEEFKLLQTHVIELAELVSDLQQEIALLKARKRA